MFVTEEFVEIMPELAGDGGDAILAAIRARDMDGGVPLVDLVREFAAHIHSPEQNGLVPYIKGVEVRFAEKAWRAADERTLGEAIEATAKILDDVRPTVDHFRASAEAWHRASLNSAPNTSRTQAQTF